MCIRDRQNSYVPLYDKDMKAKVLAHSTLIAPQETKEFVNVAKTAGEKTLISTLPGHWYLMRVDFAVTGEAPESDTGS